LHNPEILAEGKNYHPRAVRAGLWVT